MLCFIWGSSFILMRYSADELSAPEIASLRIFSAGFVFLPFAISHIRHIPRKKIGFVILTGIFGNLLPAFLFALAITKNIDSSLGGILNSLTPIFVVLIAILFFKDNIRKQKIIGVGIGFAGLLITMFQKDIHFNNSGYALLIVLATAFYGININLVSHYLKSIQPFHLASVSLAFLTIPTALVLWREGFFELDLSQAHVYKPVIASVMLGIMGTAVATALFYVLVLRAGALFASLVTYGIPFVALFWGFIYKEKITFLAVVGLLIILFGVYLANREEKN
ncbi:MAG TPA: DMT family transporter [Chitinophagaceae bacterium]|nr:DMT family transporter [Chitinophagaceae bacterium]